MTEFSKKARAFLEPMEGIGPRAIWLSWIETVEMEKESYSPKELRLIKRATSSIQAVMKMAEGKTEEAKLSAIELIVNSRRNIAKDRERRRKR
jgi:hypothetical protein